MHNSKCHPLVSGRCTRKKATHSIRHTRMNVLERSSNSATDALKVTSVADHLVEMVTISTEDLARHPLRLLHVQLARTIVYLADY